MFIGNPLTSIQVLLIVVMKRKKGDFPDVVVIWIVDQGVHCVNLALGKLSYSPPTT